MPVTFEIDRAREFTLFTLEGEVTLTELIDAVNAYGKSGVTLNELYDIRQLAGERITSSEIDAVVKYLHKYAGVRPEKSKTAVLVVEALDYGLSRMIQTLTEGTVPFKIEVFKSMELALAWLEEGSSQSK